MFLEGLAAGVAIGFLLWPVLFYIAIPYLSGELEKRRKKNGKKNV